MKYRHLSLGHEDKIAVITLAGKPVNALTHEFLSELGCLFDELEEDKNTWAVLINSSLEVFCAGADVSDLKKTDRLGNIANTRFFHEKMNKIANFSRPVICAIDGVAFGGGLELALACDIRVLGAKAKLAFPEVGIGIVPGAGGTQRLAKLIGAGKAKRLIFTGEVVKPQEAYRLGLCEYSSDGPAFEKALEIAEIICRKSPIAVSLSKKCIDYALNRDILDGLDYESRVGSDAFDSMDKEEGISAFFEKRPAQFRNE